MPTPVIVIVGLAVVALALIVVAPWRRVRAERPLPRDVEARLLMGEPPRQVAASTEGTVHLRSEPPAAAG